MTYQTVPFQISGSSYQSRSKPLSSQQTVNWYQQYNEDGKESFVLLPFYGLKPIGDFNEVKKDRGFARVAEVLYQVKGNTLYSIDRFGAHTELENIPGSGRCVFASDGTNIVIVTDLRTFVYSTDNNNFYESLATGVTGALSVDIINNQFLFTNSATTFVAYIDNLTKEIITDGQIGEETNPDNMVGDFVFEQTVWRMGVRTISGWYNNKAATPPISRLDGQLFNIGLGAKNSVANTDDYFYFLGDDSSIYRARAGTYEKVSTDAISNTIEGMNVINDAYAYCFTMQGQNFYMITFPTENLTLAVNESLGKKGWFELSSGQDGGRYQASSIINCYNKLYAADETNGKVYTINQDTYTNNDESIKRVRVTKSMDGALLGVKGKRLRMLKIKFIAQAGTGLISGQGEDPKIMVEISKDGGYTFKHLGWAKVGRLGDRTLQIELYKIETFYDCRFRITTTDPVNLSLFDATIDIKLAGR